MSRKPAIGGKYCLFFYYIDQVFVTRLSRQKILPIPRDRDHDLISVKDKQWSEPTRNYANQLFHFSKLVKLKQSLNFSSPTCES